MQLEKNYNKPMCKNDIELTIIVQFLPYSIN